MIASLLCAFSIVESEIGFGCKYNEKEKIMKNNLEMIGNSILFHEIALPDIEAILGCLQAQSKKYEKNTILQHSGDYMDRFGLVQSGSVFIQKMDFQGNTVILTQVMPGELFGEAFVCGGLPAEVDIITSDRAQILWMDYRNILSPCENACPFHRTLMKNLIQVLARKNVFLTGRIEHLSKRSLREKVLSYLSEQAGKCGSDTFEIPFNRQEFADYLAADRSALSAVLCKLRDEGKIVFYKNRFTLNGWCGSSMT